MQRFRQFLRTGLLLGFFTCLLVGCGDKDNTPTPMPLAKIAPSSVAVKLLWSHSVNDGADGNDVTLGPAIAGNHLVVVSAKGEVNMLSRISGKILWSKDLDVMLSTTPCMVDGRIFIGTINGDVYALSAKDGHILWQSQVPGSLLAAPASNGSIVVLHEHDGDVTALKASSGSRLWQYDGHAPQLTLQLGSSPVIIGQQVVVGFANGQLMAFNLTSGHVIWQRPIALPSGGTPVANMVDIDATPIYANGMIYAVTYHGNAVAISISGKLMWQQKMSSFSNMAIAPNVLFITDETGAVFALSTQSGRILWQQPKFKYRFISAPAYLHGMVIVGDYQGYIHWLSGANGEALARTEIGEGAINAQPVIADGIVYVVTSEGQVAALKPLGH